MVYLITSRKHIPGEYQVTHTQGGGKTSAGKCILSRENALKERMITLVQNVPDMVGNPPHVVTVITATSAPHEIQQGGLSVIRQAVSGELTTTHENQSSLLSPKQLHSLSFSTARSTVTMKGWHVNTTIMRRSLQQRMSRDGRTMSGLEAHYQIYILRYNSFLRPWQCSGRSLILCEYDARWIWQKRSKSDKNGQRA